MSSGGYSRTPFLLKGAIVQFSSAMLVPIPNIIVFQYNPETLQRSLDPFAPLAGDKTPPGSNIQPHDPGETFDVTLFLDATDALEEPATHPVAALSGVADRIAALEMMLYPAGDSLLGGLMGQVSVSLGGGGVSASASLVKAVPRNEVPVILFIWGPGRIVPVRLTNFTVNEQQFNQLLYPHRATVTVAMRVLTDRELADAHNADAGKDLARVAYKFTRAQKELLATANLANTVESILGMLPF